MTPNGAKNKGRLFQQWIVKQILTIFPSLSPRDVTSRSMGAAGTDVLLSEAAMKLFPYAVEAKSRASIVVYPWIEQHQGEEGTPIVFAKMNNKEPVVILYARDFLQMIKEHSETKANKS